MVNNGLKFLNQKYTLDNTKILCNRCKICYQPDKKDISVKNPNLYYKWCKRCRDYQFQKNLIHRYKKNNDN